MESLRLAPCSILLQHSIPASLWFEDAIGRYGVPTCVFDLHLLVPDIEQASDILRQEGWSPEPPSIYSFLSSTPSIRFQRLVAPLTEGTPDIRPPPSPPSPYKLPSERFATVLYYASDWGVTTDNLVDATKTGFLPPLPLLADALIGGLLDSPDDSSFQSHLSVMVAYIYAHVPELKDKAFEERMDPVHRQFHLDCLSGQFYRWTIPFIKHERQIREALRKGNYNLRECSAYRTEENKILFNDLKPTVSKTKADSKKI